jgi:hypothetical protein
MTPVAKQRQNFVTELVDCTMAMGRNVLMETGAPIPRSLLLALAVYRPGSVLIPQRKNVFVPMVFG